MADVNGALAASVPRRFHRAGDKAAGTLMAPRRSVVSGVFILIPSLVSHLVRSPAEGWS
jgi:hypothetical protein